MKIEPTTKNIATATRIVAWLNGETDGKNEPVISVLNGELLFYNAACGTDDDETVLCERLESDSFGDGWADADGVAMLDYLSGLEPIDT